MPYLPGDRKRRIDEGGVPTDVGDLTYALTALCTEYLGKRRERFQVHAEILGALTATQQEFYRRSTASYEDSKIEANGDVFPSKTS